MATKHAGSLTAVEDWLVRAHPDPSRAQTEWWLQDIAMIPTGRRFDALRIPAPLVHAAARGNDRFQVTAFLSEFFDRAGIIHDGYMTGVSYYALIPPGTAAAWQSTEAVCLEPGTWLGIPRTNCLEPPGPYWVLPPRFAGDLCAPHTVSALLAAGRALLPREPLLEEP
ncbi:hypothetical protein [Streptomyces beijiangensis]|uniref:Uncharacterized protein n=1 Tax=Streptomyces beijiangensis TaxID=163361 RepID=A0A939JDV2_9ACTN|nr:hypothetical protein [Streptomyces beijiangensis]MBO0510663.1 hypothetical protein [Streptomyces beijiangensis]